MVLVMCQCETYVCSTGLVIPYADMAQKKLVVWSTTDIRMELFRVRTKDVSHTGKLCVVFVLD